MQEKNRDTSSLSHRFYSGNYEFVLRETDALMQDLNSPFFEEAAFLRMGSLVFKGQLTEARLIFFKILADKKECSVLFKIRARFFLAVGYVRSSEYQKATEYFAQNLLAARKKDASPSQQESIFYAYQGAAFFRFYKGQYAKTIALAKRAYEMAYTLNHTYAQVLSLDLLGHSLCQMGQVRRGLYELDKAFTLASKLGNGGLQSTIKISRLKYRAQFGIDLKNGIEELNQGISSLNPEDTYSKSELHLELARQLILRGRGQEATHILELASETIYKHQNKRQSALYNLRYAHLLFLRGEKHAAWALIQSLKTNLNPRVDLVIEGQVKGLEEKVEALMNRGPMKEEAFSERPFVNFFDQRIRARALNKVSAPTKGEDPLGDLIDSAHHAKLDVLQEIKSLGLYGLLPLILNVPQGPSTLYLGPGRNEMVLMSGADIIYIDKGFTGPMKKLLMLLKGPHYRDKAWLVQETWNYAYDPLVHDALLYSTIAKIRKHLQAFSYWLEWSHEGYRLAEFVQVYGGEKARQKTQDWPPLSPSASSVAAPSAPGPLTKRPKPLSHEMNVRQLNILKRLKTKKFMGVAECAALYKTCTMTAYRDLSSLHKMGMLIKIGKGRATLYGRRGHL